MKRIQLALVACLTLAALAQAHFVYVVPSADGKGVQVVFSDDLHPDKSVPINKVAGTRLTLRADGKDTALKPEQVGNAFQVSVPGAGTRMIHGFTDYGVLAKGKGKPFRLYYHPRAILGDPFDRAASLGKSATIEILPVREGDQVKFLVLAGGKPLAKAEVFLRKPGAEESETLKTDETGHTPAYPEKGRYAVVARKLDAVSGEAGGKKYEEERHYATLVVDVAKPR